jgi:hypothetical protein
MPEAKFKLLCNGLFHSKVMYCLQVFSHVWDIPNLDQENRRFSAFTRGDNRKLQVLQNKVMRMKTNLPFGTSTLQLTQTTGDLSIQQLTAYSTLVTAQKSIAAQQPQYLARKLKLRTDEDNVPNRQINTIRIQSNLTIARSGFFCRSSALFNQLPLDMRSNMDPNTFKPRAKMWVKQNIPIKPG